MTENENISRSNVYECFNQDKAYIYGKENYCWAGNNNKI